VAKGTRMALLHAASVLNFRTFKKKHDDVVLTPFGNFMIVFLVFTQGTVP
jgi:hypothetical protein